METRFLCDGSDDDVAHPRGSHGSWDVSSSHSHNARSRLIRATPTLSPSLNNRRSPDNAYLRPDETERREKHHDERATRRKCEARVQAERGE